LTLGATAMSGKAVPGDWRKALPRILKPYGELVDDYFREEKVKAPLVWMAAQSGPPPTEPLTSPFLLWHPLYHEGGMARPRGGSGMLTQALARHVDAHGGEVHVGAPVDEILVERGRATGVRVAGQVVHGPGRAGRRPRARDLRPLAAPEHRPPAAAGMRVGNGFGAIVRLALSEPIRYAAHPHDEARGPCS
jgi:phytoene dehydrogenase-like protein